MQSTHKVDPGIHIVVIRWSVEALEKPTALA